jgi:hypothetical protein
MPPVHRRGAGHATRCVLPKVRSERCLSTCCTCRWPGALRGWDARLSPESGAVAESVGHFGRGDQARQAAKLHAPHPAIHTAHTAQRLLADPALWARPWRGHHRRRSRADGPVATAGAPKHLHSFQALPWRSIGATSAARSRARARREPLEVATPVCQGHIGYILMIPGTPLQAHVQPAAQAPAPAAAATTTTTEQLQLDRVFGAGHCSSATAIAHHPSVPGLLAYAAGGGAVLYDSARKQQIGFFARTAAKKGAATGARALACLAFSSDGTLLAAGERGSSSPKVLVFEVRGVGCTARTPGARASALEARAAAPMLLTCSRQLPWKRTPRAVHGGCGCPSGRRSAPAGSCRRSKGTTRVSFRSLSARTVRPMLLQASRSACVLHTQPQCTHAPALSPAEVVL